MSEVVTMVSGSIAAEREGEVTSVYRGAVGTGVPPGLEETFLLRDGQGRMAILSVWHRRQDLDAMLATGEEPLARRLIRQAGGSPEVRIFEVVEQAKGT